MEKNISSTIATRLLILFSLILFHTSAVAALPDNYVEKYIYVDSAPDTRYKWTREPTILVDNLIGFEQDLSTPLSIYGGFLNTQYGGTGYFRVEKINDRWWLIDPNGHLTFLASLVGLRPGDFDMSINPFKNFEEWSATIFPFLKSIGFYSGGGPVTPSQMVRYYDKLSYTPVLNTLGNFGKYIGINNVKNEKVLPVFHPEWPEFATEDVRKYLQNYNGDPRFLGLYVDIELPWSEDVLIDALGFDVSNPNYDYAVDWVKKYRGDDSDVTPENVSAEEKDEFFKHYLTSYYKVISEAMKTYAPNHLYLGSRVVQTFLLTNESFVRTYGKYVDVMSINRFGSWSEDSTFMENLEKWGGKPWVVSAFYSKAQSFEYIDNLSGAGLQTKTQLNRGQYYENLTLSWMESKGNVGWSWFEYRDGDHINHPDESLSNKGMFNVWHQPYQELTDSIRKVNRQYLRLVEYFDNKTYSNTNADTVFANFTASTTLIPSGGEITYQDQSTGESRELFWSFEGGTPSESSASNPTIKYDIPGVYNVSLRAVTDSGEDELVWSKKINVYDTGVNQAPIVSVTDPINRHQYYIGTQYSITADAMDVDGEIANIEIFINGESVGKKTSSSYKVKDLTIDAEKDYVITAVATDDQGLQTTTDPIVITGIAEKIADFSAVRRNLRLGEMINFANESAFSTTAWSWSFEGGNPATSTVKSPKVLYSEPGTYSVTLTSTGPQGSETITKEGFITVTSTANSLPEVTITEPANGMTYSIGEKVPVKVDAVDPDGTVDKVFFFINGNSIQIQETAPFVLNLFEVELGVNKIEVEVMDNDKGVTRRSVFVFGVDESVPAPTVAISSPSDGTSLVEGDQISIEADANGTAYPIKQVDFYANGDYLGRAESEPYILKNWEIGLGQYDIVATVTDESGAVGISESIRLVGTRFDNALPVVNFISPSDEARFEQGTEITIEAEAQDSDGTIAQVEFFANGVSFKVDTGVPYRKLNWPVPAGTTVITAVATDNEGGQSSAEISVIGLDPSNLPPNVKFTSPDDQGQYDVGSLLLIKALASDDDGTIASVEFVINGESVKTVTGTNYRIVDWEVGLGTYLIEAIATDDKGSQTTASITIVGVDPNNQAPTVSIDHPQDEKRYDPGQTTKIEALASDVDGLITKVEFFVNGESIGVETREPYALYNWEVPMGTHVISVVATDDGGKQATDQITVVGLDPNNLAPSIRFTSPDDGEVYEQGTLLLVKALASDEDGTVEKVEFFINDESVKVMTGSTYRIVDWEVGVGTYTFKAVATDDKGSQSSTEITITGVEPGTASAEESGGGGGAISLYLLAAMGTLLAGRRNRLTLKK